MTEEPTPNPFDPEALRLSQDFASSVGVQRLVTTVPVRKPGRQEFVRVHTEEAYRLDTAVIELKDDRETYLVAPSLLADLMGEVIFMRLLTAITRQGVLLLWPAKLPTDETRRNAWHSSALEAAELAQSRWIRLQANMSLGAYEVFAAADTLDAPEWPDLTFTQILEIAFKDRFIERLDHPVLKRLRGEV